MYKKNPLWFMTVAKKIRSIPESGRIFMRSPVAPINSCLHCSGNKTINPQDEKRNTLYLGAGGCSGVQGCKWKPSILFPSYLSALLSGKDSGILISSNCCLFNCAFWCDVEWIRAALFVCHQEEWLQCF